MTPFYLRSLRAGALVAFLIAFATGGCQAATAETVPLTTHTAAEIVEQMRVHNQARVAALKHLKSTRHYEVDYRGFATTLAARMDVEYEFDSATGKNFRIVSQSGSKLLLDKVLKRALDSEKEASQDKSLTALTPANYRFPVPQMNYPLYYQFRPFRLLGFFQCEPL